SRHAMYPARRTDKPITDLQLDFACPNRQAAAARTVRSAVGVGRAVTAVDDMAVNERRAAAGDDVIALRLIVVGNGARNGIRRRICRLFPTRNGLGRCLSIAPPGGRGGRRIPSGG